MTIRYLQGESIGAAFTQGESRNVEVINEALVPTSGSAGDAVVYTCDIKDHEGGALPASFVLDLMYGAQVVWTGALAPAVYDSVTRVLTLNFDVPWQQGFGEKTVKVQWLTQDIE